MTKPKYELGDEVYIIETKHKDVHVKPCDFCEGAGKVLISLKEKTCPVCHGKKTKTTFDKYYAVSEKTKIVGVQYFNMEDETDGITYSLTTSDLADFYENDVFADYESVENEVKQLNKQVIE